MCRSCSELTRWNSREQKSNMSTRASRRGSSPACCLHVVLQLVAVFALASVLEARLHFHVGSRHIAAHPHRHTPTDRQLDRCWQRDTTGSSGNLSAQALRAMWGRCEPAPCGLASQSRRHAAADCPRLSLGHATVHAQAPRWGQLLAQATPWLGWSAWSACTNVALGAAAADTNTLAWLAPLTLHAPSSGTQATAQRTCVSPDGCA